MLDCKRRKTVDVRNCLPESESVTQLAATVGKVMSTFVWYLNTSLHVFFFYNYLSCDHATLTIIIVLGVLVASTSTHWDKPEQVP